MADVCVIHIFSFDLSVHLTFDDDVYSLLTVNQKGWRSGWCIRKIRMKEWRIVMDLWLHVCHLVCACVCVCFALNMCISLFCPRKCKLSQFCLLEVNHCVSGRLGRHVKHLRFDVFVAEVWDVSDENVNNDSSKGSVMLASGLQCSVWAATGHSYEDLSSSAAKHKSNSWINRPLLLYSDRLTTFFSC